MLWKAILEFTALKGVHSGENMALVAYTTVKDLEIALKMISATSNSASNNATLVPILHQHLLKDYNDEVYEEFPGLKPLMKFHGPKSYIHCLAHALNRIVQDILEELKSRTMKQANNGEDDPNKSSPIAKLQHIAV